MANEPQNVGILLNLRDALKAAQVENARLRAALVACRLPQTLQEFYALWPGHIIDWNKAIDVALANAPSPAASVQQILEEARDE